MTRLWTARDPDKFLRRVPVWAWQTLMHGVARRELAYFNVDPIADVDYATDIDYAGDGTQAHRLDVITPRASRTPRTGLPVYVYFHGGGWTSGDKATLTKYCASQALAGMVVVNANYRKAPRFHMGSMLQDANAVLVWVTRNAASYGGDPQNIVLGGDSAGGHIAALITAATHSPDLADYFDLADVAQHTRIKGLVQHCSAVDFSVMLEPGFVLSLQFIRMLIPPKYRRPRRQSQGSGQLRCAMPPATCRRSSGWGPASHPSSSAPPSGTISSGRTSTSWPGCAATASPWTPSCTTGIRGMRFTPGSRTTDMRSPRRCTGACRTSCRPSPGVRLSVRRRREDAPLGRAARQRNHR